MTSRRPSLPAARNPVDIEILRPPFAPVGEAERWLFHLRRLGMRPGLDAVRELLGRLGDPHWRVPSLVVAGTNGKGSAAIMLEALFRSAGLRTALYTSPHLLSVRERIHVAGAPIGEEALDALVRAHAADIDATRATFFESLTALALRHFADEGVQLAVLEAGLGGRLDATNAARKLGVLLTSIGRDHMELLGDDLPSIAREKLGLAEPGLPFFLQALPADLHELCHDHLRGVGAEAIDLPELVERGDVSGDLPRRMAGQVQRQQAGQVLACAQELCRRSGYPAPDPGVLRELRLPGRYEAWGQSPPLVVDPAHNEAALGRVLEQWAQEGPREGRLLVLGVMADKDIDSVLAQALEAAGELYLCAPRWYRALPPAQLAQRLWPHARGRNRGDTLHVCASVREALERARARARALGGAGVAPRVLVTGSNFLVAEALDRLGVDALEAEPGSWRWDGGAPLRARTGPEAGMQLVGIDVGGTNTKLVRCDADGVVLASARILTRGPEGPGAFVRRLVEALPQVLDGGAPAALGLAVAGLCDPAGRIRQAPNLPAFEGASLATLLGEAGVDAPVAVENDVNAALYGEWLAGAARGRRDALMLSLGTGVGGGILLDGRLHHGAHGMAAELGHALLDPDGPPCSCGLRGHVESQLSTAAFAAAAREALARPGAAGGPLRARVEAGEEPEPALLAACAEEGDAIAREVLAAQGRWLGLAFASFVAAFDPSILVVGGGVSRSGEWLLGPAREELERRSLAALRGRAPLVAAELGQDGAAIGAALLAAARARGR